MIIIKLKQKNILRNPFYNVKILENQKGINISMKVLQEGMLADFLNRLMDLILLDALWLLCSLPLFTMGAATCALYEVTMRFAVCENPAIIRTFFLTFRKCFRKATILFVIFLGAGMFLAADLWCAFQWKIRFQFLVVVVILAVVYFYLAVLSHVFPILAYFDTGVRECIRKAFFLSMNNGVFTVFIMVINLSPVFLFLLLPGYFGQILFMYLIVGFGGIAMLCSLHLVRLFAPERV